MISFTKAKELKVNIEGMRCMNCVKHVTEALKNLDGTKKVNVSLDDKCATVSTKASDLNLFKEELTKAIEELGFTVSSIE